MPDQDKQIPGAGSESDISKAQSQQQPPNQASQQPETGQQSGQFETGQKGSAEFSEDQAATGQAQSPASPDAARQGDIATQQRTDVEGGSLASQETGEAESGFVGAEGQQDSSSQLVEDQEFDKDGQGAPEGK